MHAHKEWQQPAYTLDRVNNPMHIISSCVLQATCLLTPVWHVQVAVQASAADQPRSHAPGGADAMLQIMEAEHNQAKAGTT